MALLSVPSSISERPAISEITRQGGQFLVNRGTNIFSSSATPSDQYPQESAIMTPSSEPWARTEVETLTIEISKIDIKNPVPPAITNHDLPQSLRTLSGLQTSSQQHTAPCASSLLELARKKLLQGGSSNKYANTSSSTRTKRRATLDAPPWRTAGVHPYKLIHRSHSDVMRSSEPLEIPPWRTAGVHPYKLLHRTRRVDMKNTKDTRCSFVEDALKRGFGDAALNLMQKGISLCLLMLRIFTNNADRGRF